MSHSANKWNLLSNFMKRAFLKNRSFSKTSCLMEADMNCNRDISTHKRKFFSGIKPSGSIHLGNYLGAIQRWANLKKEGEDVTLCIADLHSMSEGQDPKALHDNIFKTAAVMFACGIDPSETTVFVQSALPEHSELEWILGCRTNMSRVANLPNFQDKTRKFKDLEIGHLVYPILQTADIILHKGTHVPIGEDQIPNINFAQSIIQALNEDYDLKFPICQAFIERFEVAKIRSLKDPTKKMSKSDEINASIFLTDSDDEIVEKFKRSVTDCISDIAYDRNLRPGISNLISIYAALTKKSVKEAVKDVNMMDSTRFKTVVAEVVVEHLRPIREKIKVFLENRSEIVLALQDGNRKASKEAQSNLNIIKDRLGFGMSLEVPEPMKERKGFQKRHMDDKKSDMSQRVRTNVEVPIVPKQKLRMEKRRENSGRTSNMGGFNPNNLEAASSSNQRNPEYSNFNSSMRQSAGHTRYKNKF